MIRNAIQSTRTLNKSVVCFDKFSDRKSQNQKTFSEQTAPVMNSFRHNYTKYNRDYGIVFAFLLALAGLFYTKTRMDRLKDVVDDIEELIDDVEEIVEDAIDDVDDFFEDLGQDFLNSCGKFLEAVGKVPGASADFVEETMTDMIKYILKDYEREILVFENFIEKLYKFIGDEKEWNDCYIDRGLDFVVLALSEQIFDHQKRVLEKSTIGKVSPDNKFLDNVRQYLEFASAIYASNTIIQKVDTEKQSDLMLSSYNFNTPNNVLTPEFAVVHRKDKKEVIVTIRGTYDLMDAVTNLMVDTDEIYIPEIDKNLIFHEGMLKSSIYILEKCKSVINQLQQEGSIEKITFTGHSLGGGCAQICGLLYRQMIFDENFKIGDIESRTCHKNAKVNVYTFAAPPVLNESSTHERINKVWKPKNADLSTEKTMKTLSDTQKQSIDSSASTNSKKKFVDFSPIENFAIYNFQLERDLVCYMSIGNYTRMLLALRRINELGWSKLEKVRYILFQRNKLMDKCGLEKNSYVCDVLKWFDSWLNNNKKSTDMDCLKIDLCQELINLNQTQEELLLQHINKSIEVDGEKCPCFYRLKAVGKKRQLGFDFTPDVSEKYECLKIKSDVGVEVLPIGVNYTKGGHINAHGVDLYEDAFSKLK